MRLKATMGCGNLPRHFFTKILLQGLHGDLEHIEVRQQGEEHQEQSDGQPGQDFEDDPDVAEGDPEPAV